MSSLAESLILVGCLLGVVALVQVAAARTGAPETTMFALVGIALGASYFTLEMLAPSFARFFVSPLVGSTMRADAYLWLFLPPLLFQLALTVDVRNLVRDAAPIFVLAVIAVIVATATIGWALAAVAPQSLVVCLLLGAIVATTDPSAVASIFRDVGAPSRLIGLIEGESLLNDAAAIALAGSLTALITGSGAHESGAGTTLSLAYSFCGGVLLGAAAGRLLTFLLPRMRNIASAEATLTMALPYPLYLFGNEVLGVSGVVAVVSAGLVTKGLATTRLSPRNWTHLQLVWRQNAAIAGALVFLLAAVRVPGLLRGASWADAAYVLVVVVAALAARLAVLFLIFPALSYLKVSSAITAAYKLAMAWGGLRGAVTLVLAMGAAENPLIPGEARHFISVIATGFVLFSLTVNGSSLRWVIRRLELNRLSTQDYALQQQALALSTAEVLLAVERIAATFHIPDETSKDVCRVYRNGALPTGDRAESIPTEIERLTIGLVILATRERDLIPDYGDGIIARSNLDAMMRNTGYMVDAARTQGSAGYHRAARRILEPNMSYRMAVVLQRYLHLTTPLEAALADRFELLICRCAVLERLRDYNRNILKPMLGAHVADQLESALYARSQFAEEALDVVRGQFGTFSSRLERRLLLLFALRQGRSKMEALATERVISMDAYNAVRQRIDSVWLQRIKRPSLH